MDSSQGQATLERESATLYWPSNVGRILLLALRDVIDEPNLHAVLDSAGRQRRADQPPLHGSDPLLSSQDVSAIMRALEDVYGATEATGVAKRLGRAGFRRALAEFGALFGLADLDRRLLPLRIKLGAALDVLTSVLNDTAGQQVRIDAQADRFICIVERCPLCLQQHTDAPCCYAALGLLEEMVSWVGGSARYRVQETACIGAGAATCRFVIDARPPGERPSGTSEAQP